MNKRRSLMAGALALTVGVLMSGLLLNADPALAAPTATGAEYTVTELGTLGGDYSHAFAINNRGQVVGEAQTGSGTHAFMWENGVMTDLHPVGSGYDGAHGRAYDINDASPPQIVGLISNSVSSRLATWVGGTSSLDLGEDGTWLGNNDLGDKAGWRSIHGTPYVAGYGWTVIQLDGQATAINNNRQVVGWRPEGIGFLLDNVSPFPTYIMVGGFPTYPRDINDSKTIVGSYDSSLFTTGAFVRYPDGTLGLLPALSADSYRVEARAVNNNGVIAGESRQRAVIWRNGAVQDLNDLIPMDSGWLLLTAEDINDAGQIVGRGAIAGKYRAFLLTPVPKAVDDSYTVDEDTPLSVPAPGVLSNDSGVGLATILVSDAVHGSVSLQDDGAFTYTPAANFNGLDSFTYMAIDTSANESNLGIVTISVGAINDPPTAAADGPYSGVAGIAVQFDASGSWDTESGTALTYRWDFGDGTPTLETVSPAATHAYTAAGGYTVTLVVNDGQDDSVPVATEATIVAPENISTGGAGSFGVDSFLTYVHPTVNRVDVPAGVLSVDVTIVYGSTVEPSTLTVTSNGVDITDSFLPIPGTSETVTIVLESGRNVLLLSIDGVTGAGKTGTDRDRFVFKVP